MKQALRNVLRRVGRVMVPPQGDDPRTTAATKTAQAAFAAQLQALARNRDALPRLRDCGFRVFSQFEEDGYLLYLAAVLEIEARVFVDIGAADGINSNCANLALNHGWHGLFIDGDPALIRRGQAFYAAHADTWLYPPLFRQAIVTRENINAIIADAGITGPVGVVSIDIDGNDYWIWDALAAVDAAVVMIETHIEFGLRDIVVPYDPGYVHPGANPDYFGASPVAMVRLADQKGYRLVGANRFGFNLIFVRRGLFEERVPRVTLESVLAHPRHHERLARFDLVKHLPFVTPAS